MFPLSITNKVVCLIFQMPILLHVKIFVKQEFSVIVKEIREVVSKT